MSNPWAQLVDVYGQGIDRQLAAEKSRMDSEAALPEYFMRGFFEAQKNRQAQQMAQAEMALKNAHAQYYRNSEQRDAETNRKNSIKEKQDLMSNYRKALDAYNRRAPGDSNNVNMENEIRDLEEELRGVGVDLKPFVPPRGKKIEKPGVAAGAENPDLNDWLNQPKPHAANLGDILNNDPAKAPETVFSPGQGNEEPLPMFPTKPNEPDQYEPWKGTDVRNQEGKLANAEQRTKDRAEEASLRYQDRLAQIKATTNVNEKRLKIAQANLDLRRELGEAANELRAKGVAISGGHLKLAQDALEWKKLNTKDPDTQVALTMLKTKMADPLFRMSATPEKMAQLFEDIQNSLGMNDSEDDSTPSLPKPTKKPSAKPAPKITGPQPKNPKPVS